MLEIKNLQYKYEKTENLYTYNLSVNPKEIVGILGQSGSGKSTLLDLIAGFIESNQGSIKLDQKELLNLSIERRPMSILFQNHNLFEHLNVEKNILLGLNKVKSEDIKTILKKIELDGYEKKQVSKLSGGQQQRVALARVLLRKEPILLLDEPFTGLDDKTRIMMLKLVEKITKENNLYTIMVTHNLDDCKQIANRVYKMENFELIEKKF